jgi:hypothetical protein
VKGKGLQKGDVTERGEGKGFTRGCNRKGRRERVNKGV